MTLFGIRGERKDSAPSSKACNHLYTFMDWTETFSHTTHSKLDCKQPFCFPISKARRARASHASRGRERLSPAYLAVSTLAPVLSFEISPANPPRRSRSQKIRLFCSLIVTGTCFTYLQYYIPLHYAKGFTVITSTAF